jgi:transportin-3
MLKHDTLLRSKLQYSFTEQPQLHTSLMVHLTILSPTTSQVIIAQLCLAMADLILLMPEWSTALPELIIMTALSTSNSIPLLEVLLLLPEEADSRHLRLGANRRQQVKEMLLPPITQFLATGQDQKKVITVKCYSSWMTLGAISLDIVLTSLVMGCAVGALSSPTSPNHAGGCQ